MERAFDKLHIPYLIDHIFCFACGKYYKWTNRMNPEWCPLGKHKWTELGQFARPDFILLADPHYTIHTIGIVRVDGAIHDNKKHIISDRWQVRRFHEHGIKVFIVRNEVIDGYEVSKARKRKSVFPARTPDWVHMAIAQFFYDALNDDKIYDVYMHDKDVRILLGLSSR